MSHSNPPPCFVIILIDHSAPHVEIPREFVRKHLKNKIPKDPIIRSANGGYSWKLKIRKIDENYCFAHGWNNVVKDINLGFGDFLYFRRVDQSSFIMSVYGLDGCEKILPPKINIYVVDDDVEDGFEDVEDAGEDVEDAGDDVEDAGDDVEDGDDDIDEFDEDDEEDEFDDDDEEDEFDDDDVEEQDDDVDDDDEEDDIDADIDGDDGDPFFTLTITRTHKTVLRLKPVFIGLAGIDNERPITIKNSDGEEWPMELRFDKMYKRWHLTSGWFAFARNNNLSEGDKCVFKFITDEDKLCLVKVTKKRSPTQPPPPRPRREIPAKEVTIELGDVEMESEDEGAKVVKRSCGRPPKRR